MADKRKKGYQLPPRTALVAFEGTDYDGAEVRLRLGGSLRAYFDIVSGREAAEERPRTLEETEAVYRRFAERLVSWNLVDKSGDPIPATYDGLIDLDDMAFVFALIEASQNAVGGVSAPLVEPSANGATSAEEFPAAAI